MSSIPPSALHIIHTLRAHGHAAYFAGGWVRDLLLGHPSDDIDIATDAPPEKILDLFPRTLVVGLQFGIVVVCIEEHQYEVATFRQDVSYEDGRRPTRIEAATAQEDAQRRDFTINGLFFDPLSEEILDFVEGKNDLKKGLIRAIGNPFDRFFEDRLRMLRAVRFAVRLDFHIEELTQEAIIENAPLLLPAVAMERIWQEWVKIRQTPHWPRALWLLHKLGLMQQILPKTASLHLKEVEKRIAPLHYYPPEASALLALPLLMAESSTQELEEVAKMLKAPNKEIDQLLFCHKMASHPLKNRYEEALFYAHPLSMLFLKTQAAAIPPHEQEFFFKQHIERHSLLQDHIERLRENTPLIPAQTLLEIGIPRGPILGRLLKEATILAVNEDVYSPTLLLEKLKKSPLWPQ